MNPLTTDTFDPFYSNSVINIIHIIGHIVDAWLFVYLINHYFTPRNRTRIPKIPFSVVTAIFAAVLYVTDILSNYGFYPYVAAMVFLPLIYSMLYFQGNPITKTILCFVLSYLVVTFEAAVIQLSPNGSTYFEEYTVLLLAWFILRRIGVKFILYIIVRKFLLWPKENHIELPLSCWILLFGMSLGGFLLNCVKPMAFYCPDYPTRIFLIFYLLMVPVSLLLMIKYISSTAEKNRAIHAQMVQVRVQNQYLRQQIDMMDSLKKFRHDYKAQLFTMDTLLGAGKLDELHQYLSSLHQYQYEGIHLRHYVDNESLNIILNQKATVAEKAGICFNTDITLPEKGKIDISDLSSLIMNLCDNAIEACVPIQNAEITLKMHRTKDYLMIECTNTCTHDVLKANPHLRTTKRNPQLHGLGTRIIREITEKYDGQYRVFSTDCTFTSQLMLLDR